MTQKYSPSCWRGSLSFVEERAVAFSPSLSVHSSSESTAPGSTDALSDMTVEDCGPPPGFHLPPPPRPPYLQDVAPPCPFHSCSIRPVIDAEYHSSPALPSLLSISIGSALALLTLVCSLALVCKHQKKMRNFLPCKSLPQSRCDVSHQNGGVIYEDMTNIHPRTLTQAPIEMLDVKRTKTWLGYSEPDSFPVIRQPPVFICPPPISNHHQYGPDLYQPVYEELTNFAERKRGESEGSEDRSGVTGGGVTGGGGHWSEDDFAEDEASVAGFPVKRSRSQTRGVSLRSLDKKSPTSSDYSSLNGRSAHNLSRPPRHSNTSSNQTSNNKHHARSFDRRHVRLCRPTLAGEPAFHEGLLLDALLQLYPNRPGISPQVGAGVQFPCIPCYPEKILPDQTSVRQSNDSDSGYSHNTSDGRSSSVKTRNPTHYIPDSPSLLL